MLRTEHYGYSRRIMKSAHEILLEIASVKTLRRDIDAEVQVVKKLPGSRERALAITKLQEAVMWLGMDLKRISEENPDMNLASPYPQSKDPASTVIAPTADNLKL